MTIDVRWINHCMYSCKLPCDERLQTTKVRFKHMSTNQSLASPSLILAPGTPTHSRPSRKAITQKLPSPNQLASSLSPSVILTKAAFLCSHTDKQLSPFWQMRNSE